MPTPCWHLVFCRRRGAGPGACGDQTRPKPPARALSPVVCASWARTRGNDTDTGPACLLSIRSPSAARACLPVAECSAVALHHSHQGLLLLCGKAYAGHAAAAATHHDQTYSATPTQNGQPGLPAWQTTVNMAAPPPQTQRNSNQLCPKSSTGSQKQPCVAKANLSRKQLSTAARAAQRGQAA